MKNIFVVILFCLSSELYAQNNAFDSLEKAILNKHDDESRDSIFVNLFSTYAWYKPDSALIYAQTNLILAKKLNSLLLESRALCRYGYILGLLGNYPQGINYFLHGIKITESIKDSIGMPWKYAFLSEIYLDQNDFKQALHYTIKFKNLGLVHEPDLPIEWPLRMAMLYERFNQPDSALFYGQKALENDIKINGKLIRGYIPLILGDVYLKKENYQLALNYYHIALPLASEGSFNKDLIQIYNGIAQTFLITGQKDSSIYYCQKALDLRLATTFPLGTINTYKVLYNIYRQTGRSDSAINYLEKSILLKDSLFNQQKEREVQSLTFNEQLRQQDLIAQQKQYSNRLRMNGVLGISLTLFVIALILWRNNQHKKRSNALLQSEKQKVEETLEELKSTQAQLIQSEKMASLGELTAGVAHEIQNPLNFVNNFSEVNKELLAEMNGELDKGNYSDAKAIAKDISDNQEKINHHGKRADAIVKGMLQHSRSSTGVKEPTDINALADEYLRLAYHGLKARDKASDVKLQTNFDNSIGKINVIPQDIGRVLVNLINNAFYAASLPSEGGFSDSDGNKNPTVQVSTKKIGDKVLIMVKDNGSGISQKILDKIFQPFFTTKPTGQGTGLGLSLAYDIVKAHGGEIKVETKEGEGSEFVVQLPLNKVS